MPQGILWVSSRILRPENLAPETLNDWYENEHIQEVLALPGAPSAARYEALMPQPEKAYSKEAPWLTLYEMPDIDYRTSDDFTGIAVRNPPSPQLIDSVYKNTRFDIRWYEQIQVVESANAAKSPAKFLISAALHPASDPTSLADFDKWYREEHIPLLSRMPGFVRSRRFEIASATVLSQFQFRDALEKAPRYLALHEFNGEELPLEELAKSGGTEWARKVLGGVEREEVGYYAAGRVYPESEWGSVGK